MKILALTTIILSFASGNSNLEVSQKCNKAFEYKQNKESLELFKIWNFNEPVSIHQDCNCEDLANIKAFRAKLGVLESSFYYSGADRLYLQKKCNEKE